MPWDVTFPPSNVTAAADVTNLNRHPESGAVNGFAFNEAAVDDALWIWMLRWREFDSFTSSAWLVFVEGPTSDLFCLQPDVGEGVVAPDLGEGAVAPGRMQC